MLRKWVTFCVLITLLPIATMGKPNPFESLSLSLGMSNKVNDNRIESYWKSGVGFNVLIMTGFYRGKLIVGFEYLPYTAIAAPQVDFRATNTIFAWGIENEVFKSLAITNAIGAGNYRMHFEDDDADELAAESEWSWIAISQIRVPIYYETSGYIRIIYQEVFTNQTTYLTTFSVGLSHRFVLPQAVQRVFR